jgi:uncharacterized protein with von Willebrand factor type A (vWA) domain
MKARDWLYLGNISVEDVYKREKENNTECVTLDNELRNLYPPHNIITLIDHRVDHGEN